MAFREMRRNRQQLSAEATVAIMNESASGTLALLGDDNYPYAVPMSFVFDHHRIYFHSAIDGHKIDAIKQHDKASFCVIDKDEIHGETYTTYYRSAIAFGRIHIVDDLVEKLEAAKMIGRKYHPGHEEALQKEIEKGLSRMVVIRLDVEHLTGKESIELVKQRQA